MWQNINISVQNFMKSKKLSSLGMPGFHGSGSHMFQGEKFRYLVLERYGTDIWKIFNDAGRVFSAPTVFQLGLQMVTNYFNPTNYHAFVCLWLNYAKVVKWTWMKFGIPQCLNALYPGLIHSKWNPRAQLAIIRYALHNIMLDQYLKNNSFPVGCNRVHP